MQVYNAQQPAFVSLTFNVRPGRLFADLRDVDDPRFLPGGLKYGGWGSFAAVAALSIEKARLHHEMVEKERVDQQLLLARDVQACLLPAEAPTPG